jgi:ATP/maltotriose-dependent transcriptional regulator MalT
LGRFLTEEVLDLQEPSIRPFLLHTSILEGFNAQLCATVTGLDDAGAKLYIRVLLDLRELGRLLHRFNPDLTATRARTSAAADVTVLTARERRILELLAADCTYQQISDELVVSINTVRTHLSHLYRKLSVRRQAQAVAAGHRVGILGDRLQSRSLPAEGSLRDVLAKR